MLPERTRRLPGMRAVRSWIDSDLDGHDEPMAAALPSRVVTMESRT
jgi:hypothetical protein